MIRMFSRTTLHQAGRTEIETAAEVAEAFRPIAGDLAGWLFVLGLTTHPM